MDHLRHAQRLARFVLAYFLLSIGFATAAPSLHVAPLGPVCSSSGMAAGADADVGDAAGRLLDCPLCLPTVAPPPATIAARMCVAPEAGRCDTVAAPASSLRAAAPLPARGPPLQA